MPYKNKYKYKKKNRRFKKKKSVIPRYPVPNRRLAKLRYADTITLNPTAATLAYDTWRANDCRDPYDAAGGHQPMGFDQWMAFYEKFTVIGAKITAVFSNTGQTIATSNTMCGIHLGTSAGEVSGSDVNHLRENIDTRFKYLTYAESKAKMVKTFSAKKIFGQLANQPEYTGDTSASPTKLAYFDVWAVGTDPARDAEQVVVSVLIDYVVLLTDRRDLDQS